MRPAKIQISLRMHRHAHCPIRIFRVRILDKDAKFIQADNVDSDQNAHMRRLICVRVISRRCSSELQTYVQFSPHISKFCNNNSNNNIYIYKERERERERKRERKLFNSCTCIAKAYSNRLIFLLK